jgi:hypothetical protein
MYREVELIHEGSYPIDIEMKTAIGVIINDNGAQILSI